MIRNMQRPLLTPGIEEALFGRSKPLSARRRFLPRLEHLEGRTCPSIQFTPGTPLNLNRLIDTQNDDPAAIVDNQNTPTFAIDPSNPTRLFMAALSWHGGFTTPTPPIDIGPPFGFFANYSTDGGTTWTPGYSNNNPLNGHALADGTDGGDGLPAGFNSPQAVFDKYGNLFLTYVAPSTLYAGTGTAAPFSTTFTDVNANWTPGQWVNCKIKLNNFVYNITTNDATHLTLDNPVHPPGFSGGFTITLTNMESNSLVAALSTDGGQTFKWLSYLDHANFVEHPTIVTGSGPGVADSGTVSSADSTTLTDTTKSWTTNQWQNQTVYIASGTDAGDHEAVLSNDQNTLTVGSWQITPDSTSRYVILNLSSTPNSSVWVAWDDNSHGPIGGQNVDLSGALVTGLGQVDSFITPESVTTTASYLAQSVAVGPHGQVLMSYQTDLVGTSAPKRAQVYTVQDPDGLGTAGLDTPVLTTLSSLGYGYSNGPNYGFGYYTSGDSGTVTSATSLTLTDTTKNWTTNQLQGETVLITSGTDAGDQETILANTQNTLTVTTWQTTPDSTSHYVFLIYALKGASAHLAFDRSGGAHNGRAYLVYTNSGGYTSSGDDIAADADVFERYSDDNGTTWSNPIMVNASADGGTVTSATFTTLTDTGKNWTANQWVGHSVYIVAGTDVGDSGVIASNTSNTLTLASTWQFLMKPDNTSQYLIGDGASQFWPTAALDQTSGALAATWYDSRTDFNNSGQNKLVQVFGAVSADGGQTFAKLQVSPTRTGSLDQSDGTVTGLQMLGGGTGVTYNSTGLTDTTKDWIASPSPGWWGSGTPPYFTPFKVVATWIDATGQQQTSSGYIASNTATSITLYPDPVTGVYWGVGVPASAFPPASNATYVITNDAPEGGGDANFIKRLGSSLGLDYYNGKFWSAWANESSDPSTSPNPDYFPATDPNHNPGDPQHTTNIYAIPITVTITAGPGSASSPGASATDDSAPALTDDSAPALTSTPDEVASLLRQSPIGTAPAPTVPLPPRRPALPAGASSAGADAVDRVFASLGPAAAPSAEHSAVFGAAAESVVPPDPVGELGDALTDSWLA
jgi:hypothetical protein